MRHLASILAITALLVVAATIGFGWPGWFALTAAAPGLLLGSSIAHAIDPVVSSTNTMSMAAGISWETL